MFWERFLDLCVKNDTKPNPVAEKLGIASGTVTKWKKGTMPSDVTLRKIANYFDVSVEYLKGESKTKKPLDIKGEELYGYEEVGVVMYEIIGNVSAGYGGAAIEEHTGEYCEIPSTFLKGRKTNDYFVLKVTGRSMYPRLLEGDLVLVLRCESVDSGDTAIILYNSDNATIKKVRYKNGEDWLELVPENPEYETVRIEGEDLQNCKVLGKVCKLIRNF